jgi:membrane protein
MNHATTIAAMRAAENKKPVNWRSPADVKRVGLDLFREFKRDDVPTLSAAVAFHTVFAIPAILILIVLGAAVVNRVTDVEVLENIRRMIQDHAPASTQQLLNEQVDSAVAKVSGSGLSLGIIATTAVALWSGSNAIGAMIAAFNTAYGVEESRPFPRKKALAVGLTLFVALFISLAFALLVFGERIGSWTADQAGAGSVFDVVWSVARWPAAVAAVALLLAVLYYVGPNVEQSFRWISPGSILATVLWLIATSGFGLYLRFSNPGSAYGAVGSVLVLLFFLYVTAIIFLLGAELNALIAKEHDPKTIRDLATKSDAKPGVRAEARQRLRQMHDAT